MTEQSESLCDAARVVYRTEWYALKSIIWYAQQRVEYTQLNTLHGASENL